MGIKRKDKSKLFKLFGFVQSTDSVNTRGIGLGLVISKKIVESFDGQIAFKSKWQKGSIFGFRIALESQVDVSNVNAPVLEPGKHDSLDQLSDTENDNGEGDLDMLIFGNPELPSNILNHLPNLNLAGAKKVTRIEHEINIDEDTVREENHPEIERVMIVDDEPFNLDALKITL